MSRRDTIIIAVLVNAALLMILFATAMRSDKPEGELTQGRKGSDVKKGELAFVERPPAQDKEELLNEFVSSISPFPETTQETLFTFEESAVVATPTETRIAIPHPVEEIKTVKPRVEETVVNVTVKKGDFLEKIAKANNTTVAAIMKVNNLSSTQLKVGQVLKIPLSEGKKTEAKPASPNLSQHSEYYIVKEGDNPWSIASRNRIKLEELLRINGLDEQKAKKLRPGDKLKIR